MNAPPVETLTIVNDLFAALIQALTKAVIAELEPRLKEIEERFDDQIELRGSVKTAIEDIVDDRLENYDPTDHTAFEHAVECVIDEYKFRDVIKDVINDLDLRVSVNGY